MYSTTVESSHSIKEIHPCFTLYIVECALEEVLKHTRLMEVAQYELGFGGFFWPLHLQHATLHVDTLDVGVYVSCIQTDALSAYYGLEMFQIMNTTYFTFFFCLNLVHFTRQQAFGWVSGVSKNFWYIFQLG